MFSLRKNVCAPEVGHHLGFACGPNLTVVLSVFCQGDETRTEGKWCNSSGGFWGNSAELPKAEEERSTAFWCIGALLTFYATSWPYSWTGFHPSLFLFEPIQLAFSAKQVFSMYRFENSFLCVCVFERKIISLIYGNWLISSFVTLAVNICLMLLATQTSSALFRFWCTLSKPSSHLRQIILRSSKRVIWNILKSCIFMKEIQSEVIESKQCPPTSYEKNQRTHFENLHGLLCVWLLWAVILLSCKGLCSRCAAHPAVSLVKRGLRCQMVHRGLRACERLPPEAF